MARGGAAEAGRVRALRHLPRNLHDARELLDVHAHLYVLGPLRDRLSSAGLAPASAADFPTLRSPPLADCSLCIRRTLKEFKLECPACRAPGTEADLKPNHGLEAVVGAFRAARSRLLTCARLGRDAEAAANATPPPAPAPARTGRGGKRKGSAREDADEANARARAPPPPAGPPRDERATAKRRTRMKTPLDRARRRRGRARRERRRERARRRRPRRLPAPSARRARREGGARRRGGRRRRSSGGRGERGGRGRGRGVPPRFLGGWFRWGR